MIPKIIHYCWLSGDPFPDTIKKCMETWKKKLPDYEFILWDTNRFDINSSIWVKQAFEAKKYAFAADYIRLYAVYTYGGIYMDMDVEIVRSFDFLLSNSYILGYETEVGIEAGVFGGEKGAVWLKKCLDYYKDRNFIDSIGVFDTTPLPKIMFFCLEEERKTFCIYANDYFTAKSYKTGHITMTENTVTIHHFAGSWLPENLQYVQCLKDKLSWIPFVGLRGYIATFCSYIRYYGLITAFKALFDWIKRKF